MRSFDLEKRLELEKLINSALTVSAIAEILEVSRATVYNELKLGLNPDDKNVKNYSAIDAQNKIEVSIIKKLRGE